MSFKTRIHPSPYTATIPSLVVKQWPKFRRLGPRRRLGVAMLSMLPAVRCLSLIFTLHGELETMDDHRRGGVGDSLDR